METWHYLVVGLLVVIAYRLYKIQDAVSGRGRERKQEDDEWLRKNTKPLNKESFWEAVMLFLVVFVGATIFALCYWYIMKNRTMRSILFAFHQPSEDEHFEFAKWNNATIQMRNMTAKAEGIQEIGLGVALIPLEAGKQFYDDLVVYSRKNNLKYQTLHVESEKEWN